MANWITIKEFIYPHEAHILKTKLESEGIEVFLKDELAAQSNMLANATHGVKVQIRESELENAIPILVEIGIIKEDEQEQKSELRGKLESITANIPLLKRLPLEFRLVFISTITVLVALASYSIFTLPTPEDRARFEEFEKENLLEYTWLPLLDSMVYYNPNLAIRNIENLKLDYPEKEDLYRYHGIALFNIDSFKQALEQFELVIEKSRFEYPLDLANIGYAKLKMGDLNDAIESFTRAAERKWEFYWDLAYAYRKIGNYYKAEECYNLFLDNWKRGKTLYEKHETYKYVKAQIDSVKLGM